MGSEVPAIHGGAERVVIRQYNPDKDLDKVLAFELACEAGHGTDSELFTDLMGDPLCRVRHYHTYQMLVAELGKDIVGICRAGLKEVVCGRMLANPAPVRLTNGNVSDTGCSPILAKTGYLLGLRVSALHRRMGIGLKLASNMENWCKDHGAHYVYIMTEKSNVSSLQLFTKRLNYVPLRTLSLLVHPVHLRAQRVSSKIEFTKLAVEDAVVLYRSALSDQEFFPTDIDKILGSELCAGTWIATFAEDRHRGLCCGGSCRVSHNVAVTELFLDTHTKSWAVMSVWKCNEIFKLELRGVSLLKRILASLSRFAERFLPWIPVQFPCIPDVFKSFGMQFMFGMHAEGDSGPKLLTALCQHAHNIARDHGCQVVMTEVGSTDPKANAIPFWKSFSALDDLWCVKRLDNAADDLCCVKRLDRLTRNRTANVGADFDWCQSPQPSSLFADPRDA